MAAANLFPGACLIDGRWVRGDAAITVTNPADDTVLGTVPSLGAAGAQAAVDAAERALPGWAALPAGARADILDLYHRLILASADALAAILTAEQGKPLAEAKGEILYAASFIRWFGEEARRAYGDVIPGHAADKRIVVLKQPIGVVAAITPWNFPAAMITRKAGPGWAAGCAGVIRPASQTPFSALALRAFRPACLISSPANRARSAWCGRRARWSAS